VFVDVGEPVDLDGWLADRAVAPEAVAEADHGLVRALTDDLERCLREVAPQFTDLEEAVALHAAARVALRDRFGHAPGWGPQADLADELGRRPTTERQTLCAAVRTYQAALDATGLGDVEVAARPARSRRRILGSLLLGVGLVPFALAGAIVHAPLAGLVVLLRSLRLSAPTKATVLPAVALVGALATWVGWALVLSADETGGARRGSPRPDGPGPADDPAGAPRITARSWPTGSARATRSWPTPSVHVTGTNGKGSVVRMVGALCSAAGLSAGHLHLAAPAVGPRTALARRPSTSPRPGSPRSTTRSRRSPTSSTTPPASATVRTPTTSPTSSC
jgi:hypothetical protein